MNLLLFNLVSCIRIAGCFQKKPTGSRQFETSGHSLLKHSRRIILSRRPVQPPHILLHIVLNRCLTLIRIIGIHKLPQQPHFPRFEVNCSHDIHSFHMHFRIRRRVWPQSRDEQDHLISIFGRSAQACPAGREGRGERFGGKNPGDSTSATSSAGDLFLAHVLTSSASSLGLCSTLARLFCLLAAF